MIKVSAAQMSEPEKKEEEKSETKKKSNYICEPTNSFRAIT